MKKEKKPDKITLILIGILVGLLILFTIGTIHNGGEMPDDVKDIIEKLPGTIVDTIED